MMSLWVRNDKSKLHKGEDNMLREAEKYKNVKALYVRFLLETKIDKKPVMDMLGKVSNITHIELLDDGRLLFVYDFGEAPSEKDYDEFDTFVDELSELFGYGERYSFDYASRKYKKDVPIDHLNKMKGDVRIEKIVVKFANDAIGEKRILCY